MTRYTMLSRHLLADMNYLSITNITMLFYNAFVVYRYIQGIYNYI